MKKIVAYAHNNLPSTTKHQLNKVYQVLPNGLKKILVRVLFRRSNVWPPVSCICTTYGRPHLLEEAVHSFIVQDYPGDKELIILNDYAQQTLAYEHPEVSIINLSKRFRTLGEKYKAAVGLCTHDLIFVWHDDEIYLPHRLTYAVKRHFEKKPYLIPKRYESFFSIDKAWVWNGKKMRGPVLGRYPGSSSWSRALFAAARGYAHINDGFDHELEARFAKHEPAHEIYDVQPQDIYYIQQEGENSAYQLRDFTNHTGGNSYARVADFVREQAERGEISLGRVELEPRWQTDYSKVVNDLLQTALKQELSK